jgi:general secretion pathway protein A
MYLDSFGFDEPPFSITPDPKFVFLSEKHQESLAHLVYGITRGGGAGFVQLTGEVGTGKTTICRLLLEQIPENTRIALILNPCITPVELLENICKELKISLRGIKGKLNRMVDKLNDFLLNSWAKGENTVVVIDEAQNLPRDTLEQLRLLTNLETDKQKLLQIILIGQPELRTTMRRNDLRQLAQRVTARYHLMPLSVDETHKYLSHRINKAGGDFNIISKPVARKIYQLTGGVPRLINILTDRSLLAAYSENSENITKKHVNTAANEVLPESNPTHQNRNNTSYYLLSLVLLMILAGLIYWFGYRNHTQPLVTEMAENNISTNSTFEYSSNAMVWESYLKLWDSSSNKIWSKTTCPESKDSGLACMRRQGNLQQIKKLNRPVVLLVNDKLILLEKIKSSQIGLKDKDNNLIFLSENWLRDEWLGTYFILWPMPAQLLDNPDAKELNRWSLEMANSISTQKIDDMQLNDWIIDFQRSNGLLDDGIIGSETQMALSLSAYNGPTLK